MNRNFNNETACCRQSEPCEVSGYAIPQRECFGNQDCCEAPTPPIETPKKAYSINIEQLDFGYIVRVGCQTFAVESIEKVVANLEAYLKDPKDIEKQWYSNKTLNFNVTT